MTTANQILFPIFSFEAIQKSAQFLASHGRSDEESSTGTNRLSIALKDHFVMSVGIFRVFKP